MFNYIIILLFYPFKTNIFRIPIQKEEYVMAGINWAELDQKYGKKEKEKSKGQESIEGIIEVPEQDEWGFDFEKDEEKHKDIPVVEDKTKTKTTAKVKVRIPTQADKERKIIHLDEKHSPKYRAYSDKLKNMSRQEQKAVIINFQAYNLSKDQKQNPELMKALDEIGAEKTVVRGIILDQRENYDPNRENRFHLTLIKDSSEKLEDVLNKTAAEWQQDKENGKEIPEVVLNNQNYEEVGVPLDVDEFLKEVHEDTLKDANYHNTEHPVNMIDSVFDRTTKEHEFEYNSTNLASVQKEQDKDKLIFAHIENGKIVRDEYERIQDEYVKEAEANEEVLDKDLYEYDDAGEHRDTTYITDRSNITAQKLDRIEVAHEAEAEREEESTDHIESSQQSNAKNYNNNEFEKELWEAYQDDLAIETEALENGDISEAEYVRREEMLKLDYPELFPEGPDWDYVESYDSLDYNMQLNKEDRSGEVKAVEDSLREESNDNLAKSISWRERIELEDEEYFNEPMERSYGGGWY